MKINPCFYLLFLLIIFSCSPEKSQDKTINTDPPVLYLPDDLEATLWAESPMFYNPTNIDVDIHGRIWLTEAVNYRDFNNADGHMVNPDGDRVMILKDTNGDGIADSSKVYV